MIERVDPLLGQVLDGRYRLDIRIASGGFGAIYQATHVGTGVDLAVKVVHARLASDEGIVARFQREGEALTALRSPHTIAAYELGETADGVLYIAMELLRGATLYQRYRDDGALPWRRMVEIALGVCDSLAEAHALGIVHRDLKPTNIFLERRDDGGDFVKVLDFGIAKILQHSQFDSADLTTAGLMIGTIDYMSPEQMVGGDITGASDLYTLGIVIYEMIAGKRPFPEVVSAASVLAAMLKPPAPLASVVIVPAELDRIVMRCLQKDAADRHQTAEELATDLARLLESGEGRRRSFDPDDDATQIAPVRGMSATLMAAAAPPPEMLETLPLPPAVPLPPPPATTPLPRVLAAAAARPPAAPARPLSSAPTLVVPPLQVQGPPPVPVQGPPLAMRGPPPAMQGPPPVQLPPPGLGLPPLTPVDTLRGIAMPPSRDGRANADPTINESSTARRQFDAGRAAQRDAMVRRLVWIFALVIASVIAAVIVARL